MMDVKSVPLSEEKSFKKIVRKTLYRRRAALQSNPALRGLFRVLALFLGGILASCAGLRPVTQQDTPAPPESIAPEIIPGPLERVIKRIKANSVDINKYFLQDDDSNIHVLADLSEDDETFTVRYDVAGAVPIEGGYRLHFTVEQKDVGISREDSLEWFITGDRSGILLAFDDDFRDAWEGIFDLLDRNGARVTFFMQGSLSPFCMKAQERGHEIGYHTKEHLNLTLISREEFYRQTLSDIGTFRDAGVPLRAFAYPFGLSEPWMHEILLDNFAVLRGFGVRYRVYNPETIRQGYIGSISIDNILYENDADFYRTIGLMLRITKFIGGDTIIPMTTHDISGAAGWGISPVRLEYLLQNAAALKLRFYRYGDFF
ncbi:MAG: polysaccharide deacetylase family protein [Spirochaetaceae bacterium]|jgi:peptidoglycan/xylan/chitin deacetylase (PgdA/CDA1 family)|nr:polysaccharide deacetylase family protein [Spirochaetaceae bacterium]